MTGNEAISDPKIGRPLLRTIQDQQLMFSENRFCDDSAYASRPGQPENRRHEMDKDNQQVPHISSYASRKKRNSDEKLEFARRK
jgi:hypothetical protein